MENRLSGTPISTTTALAMQNAALEAYNSTPQGREVLANHRKKQSNNTAIRWGVGLLFAGIGTWGVVQIVNNRKKKK